MTTPDQDFMFRRSEFDTKPVGQFNTQELDDFDKHIDVVEGASTVHYWDEEGAPRVTRRWAQLTTPHGVTLNTRVSRGGEIVGYKPLTQQKPGFLIIPVKANEVNDPSFLTIYEDRPGVGIVESFPQGHGKIAEAVMDWDTVEIKRVGVENFSAAIFRELEEETGLRGTGRFNLRSGHYLLNVTGGPSVYHQAFVEIGPDEGIDVEDPYRQDVAERIIGIQWNRLSELKLARRSGRIREVRTLAAIGDIEDFLENEFLDPEKRFPLVYERSG